VYRFLYRLHIAADANFRMKNRFKPGTRHDPGLGTGLSYFVENDKYKAFLHNYVSEKDVSWDCFLNHIRLTDSLY
jgi:hypothetical protein